MSPQPNPTQTKQMDALAYQRWAQELMKPGYVFTRELFDMIMRDPFGTHLARTRVLTWLEALRPQLEQRWLVSVEDAARFDLFVDDKGPRPAFVVPLGKGVTPYTTEEKQARVSELADQREQELTPDPTEPGRYVQPSGRFARAGSAGFEPDSR